MHVHLVVSRLNGGNAHNLWVLPAAVCGLPEEGGEKKLALDGSLTV